jgi:cathepsin F
MQKGRTLPRIVFVQGTGEYGASALADLSEEEFRAHYLGLDRARDDPDIHWPPADIPDVELPSEWDWRAQGAVTPVKNQVSFTELIKDD